MSASNETFSIFIEDTAGDRFECEIPAGTLLSRLAADFFEDRGWTGGERGRGQRAVVELVHPRNPDRTKRLRGEHTAAKAGLANGSILRIFPEAIAGAVDERARLEALVADHNQLRSLSDWNSSVQFEPNSSHAPTRYTVTFNHPSFYRLDADGHTALVSNQHRVEITLGAEYPWKAPRARWLTPVFHPNVHPENGFVCLGVLGDRYLPGMGLARVITLLLEMVQWRNFDPDNGLDKAACAWANDPDHWPQIEAIGGYPMQRPVQELLDDLAEEFGHGEARPRIQFQRPSGKTHSAGRPDSQKEPKSLES